MYDYIIIDNPPSSAPDRERADGVSSRLIPVATEYMAYEVEDAARHHRQRRLGTKPAPADHGDSGHKVRRPHAKQRRVYDYLCASRRERGIQVFTRRRSANRCGSLRNPGMIPRSSSYTPELDGSKAYKQVRRRSSMAKNGPEFSRPELEHRGRNAILRSLRRGAGEEALLAESGQRRRHTRSACWNLPTSLLRQTGSQPALTRRRRP